MNFKPFLLEHWYLKYGFSCKYSLSSGTLRSIKLKDIISNKDLKDLKNVSFDYINTKGSFELINEICKLYKNTKPENILITNGSVEALYILQQTLVQPFDEVICEKPVYQALYTPAEMVGGRIKFWELKLENGFVPDIKELKRLLTNRIKLVIINHPNNPTGSIIEHEKLKSLVELIEEYDCYLINDEIFHGLNLVPIDIPYIFNLSKKCISIGSMSKLFGLPGLRIGWIVAEPEIIQKCWNLRTYTSICSNILGEFLATKILQNSNLIIKKNINHIRKNFNILRNWLEEHKDYIEYVLPKAGVTTFIKIKNIENTFQFCEDFIKKYNTFLVPGEVFENMKGFVRLGFGGKTKDLKLSLNYLSQFFQDLNFSQYK